MFLNNSIISDHTSSTFFPASTLFTKFFSLKYSIIGIESFTNVTILFFKLSKLSSARPLPAAPLFMHRQSRNSTNKRSTWSPIVVFQPIILSLFRGKPSIKNRTLRTLTRTWASEDENNLRIIFVTQTTNLIAHSKLNRLINIVFVVDLTLIIDNFFKNYRHELVSTVKLKQLKKNNKKSKKKLVITIGVMLLVADVSYYSTYRWKNIT
ncbi:hypothetical protein AGLY_010339 [Aphis glycines]|uniref:Uncharacterized protein n=1 Tax=Aphis glycines TaxID=307491 RepID=A0A6G0TH10_APHGL|nr:hypothetical protein AGLY_010339 [Aphis glycines]